MNTDIAYSRADAEVELTVEVPAQGWHITQDGETDEATDLRTDFAICQCPRPDAAVHPMSRFARPASPKRPSAGVLAKYPKGHLVEREVAWTGWSAS